MSRKNGSAWLAWWVGALGVALLGCGEQRAAPASAVRGQVVPIDGASIDVVPDTDGTDEPAASDCVLPESDWLRPPEERWGPLHSQIALPGRFENGQLQLAVAGERWGVSGTVELAGKPEDRVTDIAVSLFAQTRQLVRRNLAGATAEAPSNQSFALVADGAGYYLGGQFVEGLALGPRAYEAQGGEDAFVTFLSETAEPGWSFALGGPGANERVTSLAVAPDGAVYAAGMLQPGASVEGSALEIEPFGSFFLARLDRGHLEWIHTWAGNGDGPRLAVLSGGPLGSSVVVGSPGYWDPFVRRYSAAGELEWEAKLQPALSVRGIAVDAHDQVTVVGIQRDGIDLRSLGGEQYCDGPEFAAYALQLSAAGELRWARSWSTPTEGGVNALGVAAFAEGVAVAGHYGMYSAGGLTHTVFGYLRAFDDQGRDIGQFVAQQNTLIIDLAAAGDQLRLVTRPFLAIAPADVYDLTPTPLLR